MNLRPQLHGHLDADVASEQGGSGASNAGPHVLAKLRSFPVALRWANGSVSIGMRTGAEGRGFGPSRGTWGLALFWALFQPAGEPGRVVSGPAGCMLQAGLGPWCTTG